LRFIFPLLSKSDKKDLSYLWKNHYWPSLGKDPSDTHDPCPFIKRTTGAEVPFYESIIGNFMVCQDLIETNLLQLFEHPEASEWFSIISGIIFEVSIVSEQKKAYLVTIFCFFTNLHWSQHFYCLPLPYRCSGVPD